MADTPVPTRKAARKPRQKKRSKTRKLPPYNVILLDDQAHTYEYVVDMLQSLFAHPRSKGFLMARQVDKTGRVIVMTTHKELAELKRDQIHAYGADWRIASCRGSMRATIEPAEI